uniref:Uncharacterized protein n=1 Tax=Kalanchoe fedtschenkoi TaxID=63787 RepID=A0A7N0ZXP1_KALFE
MLSSATNCDRFFLLPNYFPFLIPSTLLVNLNNFQNSLRPLSFNSLYLLLNFLHQDMTSVLPSHHYKWSKGFQENFPKEKVIKLTAPYSRLSSLYFSSCGPVINQNWYSRHHQSTVRRWRMFCSTAESNTNSEDSEDEDGDQDSTKSESTGINNEILRQSLERMIGTNDSSFNGLDLATLIRNKYGRSYDVQLIKKEFMGKNLLALNVMWKYMEQRSFPLTEEEYILRLDDVANTLRCWGAVSHIRDSLAKSRERPRIGKAVSIFIDMDESGGRANEWIYK